MHRPDGDHLLSMQIHFPDTTRSESKMRCDELMIELPRRMDAALFAAKVALISNPQRHGEACARARRLTPNDGNGQIQGKLRKNT